MSVSRCGIWKVLLVAGWSCWCLGLLCGCDSGREAQPTKPGPTAARIVAGGSYQVPLLNNPSTLDPLYVQDDYGATIVSQVFSGLIRFSPELYVVPDLAATWSVDSGGTVYRFTLRPATFHDGRPVTATDVVFSLSRLFRADPEPFILPQLLKVEGAEAYRRGSADTVAGFEAADDKTFIVRLSEPYAPFLTALGMYQAKIVPRDLLLQDPRLFSRRPVGSGPFRFVRWDRDQAIHLAKFADYFAAPAKLDQVVFRIYPGGKADAVLADFLADRLDEMPVSGSVREELTGLPDLQWLHRPNLSILFYGFNCRHPLLKDVRVRTLLAAAIDRQALVQQVYGGQFEPAASILPPGMPGYQPQPAGFAAAVADRAAFQELTGLASGQSLALEIVSAVESAQSRAELEFIKQAWAPLGVRVEPKFIPDWGRFETYLAAPTLQVYRYVWFADIPDPDNVLGPLFGSRAAANFMRYEDPEVDAGLRQALKLTDAVPRAEMYRRLEQRILTAAPLAPLFYLTSDRVYKPLVRGVQLGALGFAYSTLAEVYWVHPEDQ